MKVFILTFDSVHQVLKAEKILSDMPVQFEIVPTPRDISSNCGMSIRINDKNFDQGMIISTLEKFQLNVRISEKSLS
ncbi:MAG: DUF3343 domain-containing protein [Bacteroidia bacterium]|nr:DUF3343 domain-containing protein [Bacteroidia bacterium]